MPNRGEMHANLMSTSGLQIHGYQSGLMAETLQHIPVRNGRFAGRSHAEAEIGHFGAPDRRLNGCFVLFKTTLHERMIGFLYLMLGELRRISVYARSDLHTNIKPEVPTSRRETMPSRPAAP